MRVYVPLDRHALDTVDAGVYHWRQQTLLDEAREGFAYLAKTRRGEEAERQHIRAVLDNSADGDGCGAFGGHEYILTNKAVCKELRQGAA